MESNHEHMGLLEPILYTPDCGQNYLRNKSLIGLGFSLFLIIYNLAFRCDVTSNWIALFTFTRIIDVFLKVWLLLNLAGIKYSSNSQYSVFVKTKMLISSKQLILSNSINYISWIFALQYLVNLISRNPSYSVDIHVNIFIITLRFAITIIIYLKETSKEISPFSVPIDYLQTLKSVKQFTIDQEHIKVRENCGVCMINFEEGEVAKQLPCNDSHIFHSSCIESWLLRKQECPLCRRSLPES